MNFSRLFQFSDLHLFSDKKLSLKGERCYENCKRLSQMVFEKARGDKDMIMISGDLSHDTTESSYKHVGDLFKNSPVPVYWLPGNHDNTKMAEKILGAADIYFPTRVMTDSGWQVLPLDSTLTADEVRMFPGIHPGSGYLSETTLRNLRKLLQENPCPTILVLHHHLIPVNGAMDRLIVINHQQCLREILEYPNIHLVLCGHVHQVSERKKGHIWFLSTAASSYQIKPRLPTFEVDEGSRAGCRQVELREDGTYSSKMLFIV